VQKYDRVMCPVCYFKFCKVVWRCYLGEVGKFNRTVWLIYPRHCIPVSIKIGQHLLKLCTKVVWCVFLCPTVYYDDNWFSLTSLFILWVRPGLPETFKKTTGDCGRGIFFTACLYFPLLQQWHHCTTGCVL